MRYPQMSYFEQYAGGTVDSFFRTFAKPGDLVFDIGANLGQSTMSAAVAVGIAGRVYSFEPNPVTFKVMSANLKRMGLVNVTPVELALSDRSGSVDFYVDMRAEFGSQGSSLRELDDLKAQGKTKKTSVKCSTLDAFCAEHQLQPKLLKIDVESFEPQVVAGGRNFIEGARPIILFEFWESWWDKGFRELFEYLAPLYRLIRIQDGMDVEKWYYSNVGPGVADILCLPR